MIKITVFLDQIKIINMKKLLLTLTFVVISVGMNAQLKKDGTPDMRYKANKSTYSPPSSQSSSTYSTPQYKQPTSPRTYNNGGAVRVQDGYQKSNGTYVAPHLKTSPDNKKYNNLKTY